MRTHSWWIPVGAVFAGLAVVTGAVAAHVIDASLAQNYAGQTREVAGRRIPAAQKYLADFKTASQYQMAHGLGLIVVGLLCPADRRRTLAAAGWAFVLGICLFSGSLYWLSLMAHVMTEEARRAVGLAAASGGTMFIIGWFCLAAATCPCGSSKGRIDG